MHHIHDYKLKYKLNCHQQKQTKRRHEYANIAKISKSLKAWTNIKKPKKKEKALKIPLSLSLYTNPEFASLHLIPHKYENPATQASTTQHYNRKHYLLRLTKTESISYFLRNWKYNAALCKEYRYAASQVILNFPKSNYAVNRTKWQN